MDRTHAVIGNLLDAPLDAIWQGEQATELRNKIKRWDFSACRMEACPHLQNDSLKTLSPSEFAAKAQATPEVIP